MLIPTTNPLSDFFTIFKIPTLILNNNFEILYSCNQNIKFNNKYISLAISHLSNYEFIPGSITIDIDDKIQFTSIQFYHYSNTPTHILIGPYKLDNINDVDSLVPLITQSSLSTLIEMYNFIINSKKLNKYINDVKIKSPCVYRAIEYIENNYTNEISIDELCSDLNINKCYFCSIFKKEVGTTFINYLNEYKVEKSKDLLKNSNLSLLDIALTVGFNNQSYYSKVFKKITCKTPVEFRNELENS